MGKGDAPIGAFRRRVALQAPVLAFDDAGGASTTFSTVASLWAELRWLSGDERWRADRSEQAARYEITIRWRAGIDAGMRFSGAGRIFGIVSVGDPAGNRTRLVCLAEEISP
ncbi:MAG: phage head closure protein [Bosea sp. (in: a-proteobacteria)]